MLHGNSKVAAIRHSCCDTWSTGGGICDTLYTRWQHCHYRTPISGSPALPNLMHSTVNFSYLPLINYTKNIISLHLLKIFAGFIHIISDLYKMFLFW